jgi:membrane fusion protein (multidrug efflux system)
MRCLALSARLLGATRIQVSVRYIVVVAGVIVILGGLAVVKYSQIHKLIVFGQAAAAAGPPPETVGTAEARQETWENRLFSVGTVASSRGVTVSSEMSGTVQAIRFESGRHVRQGQILVELDRGVELAQLASAEAREQLARTTVERSRALFAGKALPKAQLENDESLLRSASADVASLKAQIERKVVRAPFSGRLGIRMVNVGQYLTPGTPITELESEERDYVDFTLPQQDVDRLKLGMQVRINEGAPGLHGDATIAAIQPVVDPLARSGRVRAALNKSEIRGALTPGMFVNVAVVLPEKRKVVVIPATALVHASYGDSVFIVEERKDAHGAVIKGPDGKPALVARQHFVKPGEARGDFIEIVEGVSPGEQVVSQGAFKLRNGAPIVINNAVDLKPQLNPAPANR